MHRLDSAHHQQSHKHHGIRLANRHPACINWIPLTISNPTSSTRDSTRQQASCMHQLDSAHHQQSHKHHGIRLASRSPACTDWIPLTISNPTSSTRDSTRLQASCMHQLDYAPSWHPACIDWIPLTISNPTSTTGYDSPAGILHASTGFRSQLASRMHYGIQIAIMFPASSIEYSSPALAKMKHLASLSAYEQVPSSKFVPFLYHASTLQWTVHQQMSNAGKHSS